MLTTVGMVGIGVGIGGTTVLGSGVGVQTIVLQADEGTSAPECPGALGDAWHFVLAPVGAHTFESITLHLAGELLTFGSDEMLANGSRLDDVFVAVPEGYALEDLSVDGDPDVSGDESTAVVSPATGAPTFILSHVCRTDDEFEHDEFEDEEFEDDEFEDDEFEDEEFEDDEFEDDEFEESEFEDDEFEDDEFEESEFEEDEESEEPSSSSSSTSTTSTTTTTTVPCPFAPTSPGAGCLPEVAVTSVCYEIPASDGATTYWYELANLEQQAVTVEWQDGAAELGAGSSQIVQSTSTPIIVSHQGRQIASAEEAVEACQTDVTFTKQVQGPSEPDAVYTIQISRMLFGEGGVTLLPEGEPFLLAAGESITIALPSTFNPEGVNFVIEEVDAGGAAESAITPDSFTLHGHRGEAIRVTITNSFAAISLDKQVSMTTDVLGGDTLSYTLVATNTGAVTLDPVTILDRLPAEVTYVGYSIADGAGGCVLVETEAPQLVRCTLDDPTPASASTKPITLDVTVADDVEPGTQIVNQAMALGTYAQPLPVEEIAASDAQLLSRPDAVSTDMSCTPTEGQVCDLSARVGSSVAQQATTTTTTTTPSASTTTTLPPAGSSSTISPPSLVSATLVGQAGATTTPTTVRGVTPTTVRLGSAGGAATPRGGSLPSTGSDATSTITILGMGFVVVGLTMMLGSRRKVVG